MITKYFEEIDGELVKKEIDQSYFLSFYEDEYSKALEYFQKNPTYIVDANDTIMVFISFGLVSLTIACSIVYLLIPLLSKKKVTPAQLLLSLMLVDYVKDLEVTNKQIIIRFFVILLFEYWVPILLFVNIQMLGLVPILITIVMMSFTKKNLAPHDYLTGTMVITTRNGAPNLEGKPEIPPIPME